MWCGWEPRCGDVHLLSAPPTESPWTGPWATGTVWLGGAGSAEQGRPSPRGSAYSSHPHYEAVPPMEEAWVQLQPRPTLAIGHSEVDYGP